METSTHTAPPVVSTDLFSVDGKTDLCLRMVVYCAFDDKHGDMTSSEVLERLDAFFHQDTIQKALKLAHDGWIPPRVDLSFYSENKLLSNPYQDTKNNATSE